MPSLGIGLGLTVWRRGAAAFTPALVSGYLGGIYAGPARSAGLLWQDSGESTPATADTDPVYVAGDPYSATEMTTNSDAKRCILHAESGGKWSLGGNGVNSTLETGFASRSGEFCFYCAAVRAGATGTELVALASQADATFVGWFSDDRFYIGGPSGIYLSTASAVSTTVVRGRRNAGGTCYLRFGGGAEVSIGSGLSGVTLGFTNILDWPANHTSAATNHLAGIALYSATPSAGDDADLMAFFEGLLP